MVLSNCQKACWGGVRISSCVGDIDLSIFSRRTLAINVSKQSGRRSNLETGTGSSGFTGEMSEIAKKTNVRDKKATNIMMRLYAFLFERRGRHTHVDFRARVCVKFDTVL